MSTLSTIIVSRFFWSVVIVGAGFGIYWLANKAIISKAVRQPLDLVSFSPGVPGILYFSSQYCQPCKTIQRPAIHEVRQAFGNDFQYLEIDAIQHPELAEHWGVLTLPTTFIIDSQGQPRKVNHGATKADKLISQLKTLN